MGLLDAFPCSKFSFNEMKTIITRLLFAGAVVCAGFPACADDTITYTPNDDWKTVKMSPVRVKPGSALDLSSLVESGPAGKHGRVIATKTGGLAFADLPDKEVRFTGFNWWLGAFWKLIDNESDEKAKESIKAFVSLAKRQGYNVIRPSFLDTFLMRETEKDLVFNPRTHDMLDYLFAQMKEAGIYLYMDISNGGLFYQARQDDGQLKSGLLNGDPTMRRYWKEGAALLLNHVNPYTGTKLIDDPMLICINFVNELEIVGIWGQEELAGPWRDWLKARYPSVAAISKAWDDSTTSRINRIDEIPVYDKKSRAWSVIKISSIDEIPIGHYNLGTLGRDFASFLHERYAETLEFFRGSMRELGYEGLTTQYDMGASMYFLDLHNAVPVVSMHHYAGDVQNLHPQMKITQTSHIRESGNWFCSLAGTRHFDKPFLLTEYAHGFPNQYVHEGLIFGAYGALQNFQGLLVYCNPVYLDVDIPMESVRTGLSPAQRATEFLTACLYMRGDVAPSPHRVEIRIAPDYVKDNMFPTLNSDQTRLALLTGFGVRYCDPAADAEPGTKADMVFAPGQGAPLRLVDAAANVVEAADPGVAAGSSSKDPFELKNAVDQMRRSGILPSENITDPDKGIFQSDTGELTLVANERKLSVISPRTEAVTLNGGQSAALSSMNVTSTSAAAAVALCSMDNAPLGESRRMVLIYNTEAVNTGMKVSGDRTVLHEKGSFPPLMRTGTLSLSIKNTNSAGLKAWALGLDGERREQLDARLKDGHLVISIDTGKLKDGPTPFFEIARE